MQEFSDWLVKALAILGPEPYLQLVAAGGIFLVVALVGDVLAGLLLRRSARRWPVSQAQQLVRPRPS